MVRCGRLIPSLPRPPPPRPTHTPPPRLPPLRPPTDQPPPRPTLDPPLPTAPPPQKPKKLEAKRPDETMKEFKKRVREETKKTLIKNAQDAR